MYESNEYRASKNWPYAISAGCVVYRPSKDGFEVLLLKRGAGHPANRMNGDQFNLPKGHVEFDETIEQTAARETAEEAGCEVKVVTYIGSKFWDITHPIYKVHVEKTVHYFAAEWQKDLEGIDSEHDETVWASLDEAEKLLGKPNPKGEDEIVKRLKKFLELGSVK